MEKEYDENSIDWNATEGDFMGFLKEKRYDDCNAIIDNLADQKEFSKALELCMKRCAAIMKDRMTLPADYGEESHDYTPTFDSPECKQKYEKELEERVW